MKKFQTDYFGWVLLLIPILFFILVAAVSIHAGINYSRAYHFDGRGIGGMLVGLALLAVGMWAAEIEKMFAKSSVKKIMRSRNRFELIN